MKLLYDDKTKKLIIQESESIEYKQVKLWLEQYVTDYQYTPEFKFRGWDGKVHLFNNGKINFGLWKEILKALQVINGEFEIINKKDFPLNRTVTKESVEQFCLEFFKDRYKLDENGNKYKFYPYEHQIEAAYLILRSKYCCAEVATSGGKTLVLSIVIFYILKYIKTDAKILLIVPNLQLVTQFYDDLIENNTGKYKENLNPMDLKIHEIMSDQPRKYRGEGEPNVYISTYQSLSNIENFGKPFYEQFHTVMVDEAHQSKIKSIRSILNLTMLTAEYRFGVSGSFPKDGDANWLTIQSLTGPKVTKVRAKDLQDLGIITPIKIKCIYANHDNPEIEENLRNIRKSPNMGTVAYRMEGDFIRRSESRLKLIWKIVNKVPSNTLILFNIVEYGENVLKYLENEYSKYVSENPTDHKKYEFLYVDGSISKKNRSIVKTKMEQNDGVIRILIASYGTFSTGISINNIHNIILAEGFKAEARIIQSLGRALRLHHSKKVAMIFDIIDIFIEKDGRNVYKKHGEKRKLIYKEHEYPFDEMKINL